MTGSRRSTPGAAGNAPVPDAPAGVPPAERGGEEVAAGAVLAGQHAAPGEHGGGATPGAVSRGPLPGARRWVVAHGSALFAIAVALVAVGYFVEALHYQRGTSAQPGPGLFPQVVAVAIFVAAAGTAVTTWRTPPPTDGEAADHHAFRPVTVVVGAVLFVSTIHPIGFFFAAALALIVVEVGMGVRNPFRVALYSLLLAFVAQLLFVDVLNLDFFSNVHFLSLPCPPAS